MSAKQIIIKIPQTNPTASYLVNKVEIDSAIQRVLGSGKFILGQEVEAFEKEFATYIGVEHAIGVANGTDALELSLRACGVGPGDLVFTVSHTAVATVSAIELTGATPVMVDINPETFTMDPNCLEYVLANPPVGKPKAIIPVHLYGHPAEMSSIMELAKRHNLFVIEDCAQSHGASLNEHITGTWGDIAAFSFYPTKNLGAIGDGGMIVTKNSGLAEQVRLLQQYGWRDRYISEIPGGNSRLDELQAGILRVKLRYLENENRQRQALAKLYQYSLSGSGLILPVAHSNVSHVYHQYVVRLPRRDELKIFLQDEGIGTLIHYPLPVHLQPAYKNRLPIVAKLSWTEKVSKQILSLPMFPQLNNVQCQHVTNTILKFLKIYN